MNHLEFHSVWNNTLSPAQKDEFSQAAKSFPSISGVFDAVLLRGKYKKNGGAVATVFLRNGHERPLTLKQVKAAITNKEKELVASATFELDLSIRSLTLLPWSFVFPQESVELTETDPAHWNVHVKILDHDADVK